MSWITVIWSMVASACLTLAGVHLLVWFQRRTEWAHLFFALAATATASMAFCELSMFQTDSIAQYGMIHRWVHLSYWVVIISLVCYVRGYMGAGRLWLAWTVCALRTLALILNFASPTNLNFREITALRHIQILGEPVAVAQGIPNPWIPVGITSLLLFLVFLADAALTLWRRRERRSMLLLIGTMVFFIAASTGQVLLALWKIVVTPPIPSLFFLGVVAAMSWELSRETIRAEQMSEELSKKEEWLDLAADAAGVGLWSYDVKTGSIWATERAMELYGFAPDESIDLDRFLTVVHEDDRELLVQIVEKSVRDDEELSVEYRIVLHDRSNRWMVARGCTQKNSLGETICLIGAVIDVSGRKQLELDLLQKRTELAHVTRVSTMGQLAATLAHELNQPLGAILRNAEAAELFLQEPSPDLDELRAILADIRTDDQRASEVIDRMRGLMKLRKDEKCLLDLNLLAGEVITLVRPDADKRQVALSLEFDAPLPTVFGDRVQVQQVLINLLLNAMDALNVTTQDKRIVTVSVRPAGATVEVAISDNGTGIAADKMPQLFEPFFTTKQNGLGMGLSISRGIIEEHGGRLWAQNNEAGGATFIFSLPAATGGSTA